MKQEKIVDKSNLAIVVGEMGMDYYLQKVWNAENIIFEKIKKETESELNSYITCSKTPKCIQKKSIGEINNETKLKYIIDVSNEISNIKNSAAKKDDIDINDKSITYELIELKTENEIENKNNKKKVDINLQIRGTSTLEIKNILKANITLTLEDFILQDQSTPKAEIIKSKDIYDYFLNEKDFNKNFIPCNSNKKCLPGKYFTNGLINIEHANNMVGLVWLHDGMLNVKSNMINMDSILIVKSIKVEKHLKNLYGNLILMGGNDKTGKIEGTIELGFKSSGKVCINVDGYPKVDIEKIKFNNTDNNRVLFYSSATNPDWPSSATVSQRHSGSLASFVNTCSGLKIREGSLTNDPYITPFFFGSSADVNYQLN